MRPTVTDGVARFVGVSVGRSVTIVNPAKTAEPIEMSFGLWTQVGPRNHIFDGGPGLPMRTSNFERTRGGPLCKNGQTGRDAIWEVDWGGSREAHV